MKVEQDNQCDYTQATDVGCIRELNEDSLLCQPGLYMVADGMGGHACGEVASAMAIDSIKEQIEQGIALDKAIQVAHQEIVQQGNADPERNGMGTTIVALQSEGNQYQISWVGDSRAYLWDKKQKQLVQLTEDHSLIVKLVKAGLLSKKDAVSHPQRHMITQCLGSTEVDTLEVGHLEGIWSANQQVILCSDGMTDDLTETDIADIMQQTEATESRVEALIDAAKQKGGLDNISVVIVDSPVSKKGNAFVTFINDLKNRVKTLTKQLFNSKIQGE